MYMFALTVSIVELKNIKEAMVDSAWIEAMEDELYQFIAHVARLDSFRIFDAYASHQVFSNLSDGHEKRHFIEVQLRRRFMLPIQEGGRVEPREALLRGRSLAPLHSLQGSKPFFNIGDKERGRDGRDQTRE
ncbi:hypothetical protein Tco_1132435 [Tanacetum coccineum]|uniref:Gag-Pol polyprotein n=1 Tax=Tanacetum coccineum TaxID=301880 RepID=A0ABQ5JCH5_9ASTR